MSLAAVGTINGARRFLQMEELREKRRRRRERMGWLRKRKKKIDGTAELLKRMPKDIASGMRLGAKKYELFQIIRVRRYPERNTLELWVRPPAGEWQFIRSWKRGKIPVMLLQEAKRLGWEVVGNKAVRGEEHVELPP